jgi:hypothetical protein
VSDRAVARGEAVSYVTFVGVGEIEKLHKILEGRIRLVPREDQAI